MTNVHTNSLVERIHQETCMTKAGVEVEEEGEEVWTTPNGINVFDCLDDTFETRQLYLTKSGKVLKYVSYSESSMTPLDLNFYSCNTNSHDNLEGESVVTTTGMNVPSTEQKAKISTVASREFNDEFYDGTGTLVWLAAKAMVHMIDLDVHRITTKYIIGRTICELGCGTGLPGIATLLLTAPQCTTDDTAIPTTPKELRQNDIGLHPSTRILFTDNDPEALENCKQNCELNAVDSTRYSHYLLNWGSKEWKPYPVVASENHHQNQHSDDKVSSLQQPTQSKKSSSSTPLTPSVDTILAADVLYDMKMIPPLMQTAAQLLLSTTPCSEKKSVFILSHVPRFCLPRDYDNDSRKNEGLRSNDDPKNCSISSLRECNRQEQQPYDDLEDHIVQQANVVGLTCIETIRPHQGLSEQNYWELSSDHHHHQHVDDPHIDPPLQMDHLRDMHAVIFFFELVQNVPIHQHQQS